MPVISGQSDSHPLVGSLGHRLAPEIAGMLGMRKQITDTCAVGVRGHATAPGASSRNRAIAFL